MGKSTINATAVPHTAWPCLFVILAFGVGCTTRAPADFNAELFEQHEFVTGTAKHQTVLPGYFLGAPTAELVVIHIDKNGKRRLQMFGFEGGRSMLVLDAALGPDVLFVDVARFGGGRDRLITYQEGRLNWFDPDSVTERALLELGVNFKVANPGEIPHVDITRDLNQDGRDDLVVPDVDGFWISTQQRDGSFSEVVKLGPPEPFRDEIALDDSRSYGEVGITTLTVPWYLSRVHEMDYNQDGRSDLVFWNGDHFKVYCQDKRGQFDPLATTFTTGVPFDSDGTYSLMFGFNDESTFALLSGFRETTRRTVLNTIRDVNGDSVADLVIHSLEGRSLLKQRSRYDVHFGTPTAEGTLFARNVSTVIQPQVKAGGLEPWGYASHSLQDFDGDGQIDVMFSQVRMGIGKMIRALLGNSVSVDLEFFHNEDGIFPDKPTTRREIRPDVRPFSGRDVMFFPAALLGDVNGDGRLDLLVGKSRDELLVFVGVNGPELFEQQPQRVEVALPADHSRDIWLVDLNKDQKQDVLIYHPFKTEPHRLTVLMAR